MFQLRPCSACLRHLREEETRCPFCDTTLAFDVRVRVLGSPGNRLGRAARLAVGAAVASASIAGCGSSGTNTPTSDAATVADTTATGDTIVSIDTGTPDTGVVEDSNIAKPYGAPPADGYYVI